LEREDAGKRWTSSEIMAGILGLLGVRKGFSGTFLTTGKKVEQGLGKGRVKPKRSWPRERERKKKGKFSVCGRQGRDGRNACSKEKVRKNKKVPIVVIY